MRILAAIVSLTLGCGVLDGGRGSGTRGVETDQADASALPDGATLAPVDAGQAAPDAYVEVEGVCHPDLACGAPGAGTYVVCSYYHLGTNNERATACAVPGESNGGGGTYACGACPADPVCTEPCEGGTVQCYRDPDEESNPAGAAVTICSANPVATWGEGRECGACPATDGDAGPS